MPDKSPSRADGTRKPILRSNTPPCAKLKRNWYCADKIEVLGRLTDIYVPPSNFLISEIVGFLNEKPLYIADQREVAEVIEITGYFFAKNVIQQKEFVVPSTAGSVNVAYYNVGNVELWGSQRNGYDRVARTF